jgi:prepilin-type processing-associated H-X9-DG protein
LIEVLMVIAIIAILATLTLRATSSARAAADQARCVGNLRQWCGALASYTAEHEGELPRRGQGEQPVTQLQRREDWFNALPPYLNLPAYGELAARGQAPKPREQSLFVCPCAKSTGTPHFLSYAMNMYLSPWNRPAPDRLPQLARPESRVFRVAGPGGYASTIPSAMAYYVPARPEGRVNVAFLDGHVAAFEGEYIGCGKGAIEQPDVHWRTGLESPNAAPIR